MKNPHNPHRISDERHENRHFVDAIRECMGLDPLYAPDRPSSYHYAARDVGELEHGCRRAPTRGSL